MNPPQEALAVTSLGKTLFGSPLGEATQFFGDTDRVLYDITSKTGSFTSTLSFERAGPRKNIFFDPSCTTAAIVTCGGLSPGLNNVIQSLVFELQQNYGVDSILGIRHGFQGFLPSADQPINLSVDSVHSINRLGGSILGSSRGPVDPKLIASRMRELKIDILFCIGGDGTQRGAQAIVAALKEAGEKRAVVGIPKTIDNDVPFVWQTFGFATAVERAREVILHADIEAQCFKNSICIVKLMGREAGFIAMFATLAAQCVDFCLIPEVPFKLEGENGLIESVFRRISDKNRAVIVVAEGAGQEFFPGNHKRTDASGNVLQNDIGILLKEKFSEELKNRGMTISVRLFDPSYSVRAVAANVSDAWLCDQLARAAVHAAMAGKTDLIIGHWYNNLVHVPIPIVCSTKKRVNPKGMTYQQLLAVTGQ